MQRRSRREAALRILAEMWSVHSGPHAFVASYSLVYHHLCSTTLQYNMASAARPLPNMLRAASRSAATYRAPASAQWTATRRISQTSSNRVDKTPSSASEPPGFKGDVGSESRMIRSEGPAEGQPKHSPDYNVAADYRSSYVEHGLGSSRTA